MAEHTLTEAQRKRLGLLSYPRKVHERGWTREQFHEAFKKEGFNFSSFERAVGLAPTTVSQAVTRRFLKADKIISQFLDVPLHTLWPNRYLVNGAPIDYRYKAHLMTDSQLQKLNESVMNSKPREVKLPAAVRLPIGVGNG